MTKDEVTTDELDVLLTHELCGRCKTFLVEDKSVLPLLRSRLLVDEFGCSGCLAYEAYRHVYWLEHQRKQILWGMTSR
jgi:hypothetical protein